MSSNSLEIALTAVTLLLFLRIMYRRIAAERRLRTAAERALTLSTHLSDLTATLARNRTEADVMHSALAELLHAFDAAAGAVFVVVGEPPRIAVGLAIGYGAAIAPDFMPDDAALVGTPVGESIRRQELVIVGSRDSREVDFPEATSGPEATSSPEATSRMMAEYEAAAVLPLVGGNRALGAVALSFDRSRGFDGGERSLMLAAGRHIALALVRARAYERAERARADGEAFRVRADAELRERQRAEERLRESEGKYRALATRTARLYELSAGLSKAITLDAVAKAVVRHGMRVAGASAGSVTRLVERSSAFETLYAEGYTDQAVEAWHRFDADTGLCATAAVLSQEPVFVPSLTEWLARYPGSAALAAEAGYVSAAALPLVADGAVAGVLSFHFPAPVNFSDDYAALLRSVAQHCAQALDRARLYDAAQHARADAESANRAKDDFLSTLSHELRTPLTAMLGWASMLRSGMLDATRTRRALDAIFNNASRQAQLIEDLLDVSRIIAGRASIELVPIDLHESARAAVDAIMPTAEAKGVDVRFDDIPSVSVEADPRRLEQVFLNLLSNAVKFTPAGGRIAVDAVVSDTSVDVRFTDNGAGIDPAFLPHVFDRFRQADSTHARKAGGLGLGLFIARHLVEAQGGAMRAASEGAGRGTTFIVTLPLASAVTRRPCSAPALTHQAAGFPDAADTRLSGVRVLLVDDEPDAREVMASALEHRGASVTPAGSARDAIDTLVHGEFDVLLADIGMPGQDGYDLIREVRALPTRQAQIPAAAVTAFASHTDRERALAAGFQMHVAKPIPPEALARTVAALVRAETC